MLKLFRQSGMPRRRPPSAPACAADAAEAPRIASPMRGVSYALAQSVGGGRAQTIPLEASAAADASTLFWFDGRALIGSQPAAAGSFGWRPTEAGLHMVRVVDDRGRSAERDVDVQFTR